MKYQIVAVVDAENLGAAITAVQPHLSDPLQVAPLTPSEPSTEKRKKRGESPVHETRLGKLVLEILSTGPCSVDDLSQELRSKGFAATSVSPVTSRLTAEGLIERYTSSLNGRGTRFYKLLPPSTPPK